MHRFFIFYFSVIVLSLGLGLLIATVFYNAQTWAYLAREFGLIENMTAIIFALTAIFASFLYFKAKHNIWIGFSFLMAIAAIREMDYHKQWTSDSIFKTNFYENPEFPIHEKIFGILVICALIYAVIKIGRFIPEWIRDLRHLSAYALSIFFGLGLLAFAKLLDGLKRYIPLMADFHINNKELLNMVEESFELASAFCFLCICLLKIVEIKAANAQSS
jgi:hypothetical protein